MEAGSIEGEADQFCSERDRNFLQRFSGDFSADEVTEAGGRDSDEIELGLSLGGCFRLHARDDNRLVQLSSIPAVVSHEFLPAVPLARACSLPSETEEELWRTTELQVLKRMEEKRKMEDKGISDRIGERSREDIEREPVTKMRRFEVENGSSSWISGANRVAPPGLPRWTAGAARPSSSVKSFSPASQGSIASQGSCSSGGSEFANRSGQGSEAYELSTCASNLTTMEDRDNNISSLLSSSSSLPTRTASNGTESNDDPSKKNPGRINNAKGEMGTKMMEEMPCVSTKGIGPNGRRIKGFLYRYRKGEEVRIVCICHGRFFSPAEFVKHAGGGDVAHPLRHIVVNPSSAALL